MFQVPKDRVVWLMVGSSVKDASSEEAEKTAAVVKLEEARLLTVVDPLPTTYLGRLGVKNAAGKEASFAVRGVMAPGGKGTTGRGETFRILPGAKILGGGA